MWSTQTPHLRVVRPTGLTHLRFSPRITVCLSWVRDTNTGAKSMQQMEGKKSTWWDMMRRLQESQLRGTQKGWRPSRSRDPEFEPPHEDLLPNTDVCRCLQSLFWNCKYRLRDFISGVTSRLRSWPLHNLNQLTEQVMGRHGVFLVPCHRPWQNYRIGRKHPPGHPVTTAVLRRAIKETQCLLYRLSVVTDVNRSPARKKKSPQVNGRQ